MAKRKAASKDDDIVSPAAEEYTVLARRYRPQLFDELVGQEPVAQSLINALTSNRVAHAYLFTGARGVGKTSTARILAKCLNCVKGPTAQPCGECESCRSIAVGEDVDVLEIDAASHNKVDQIRELRENVHYRPIRGRYKIYIIDEVHMLALSRGSFDALLKTLEEPPEHVKFIFCTTEATKIPATILSRCQRFDFAGIGLQRIIERLKHIVAGEKMQADSEALELVARRARHSMRDAQSLLDQLLAFGSDKLTVEQVHQLLGTANEDRVASLAEAALTKDAKNALDLLAQAADQGVQLSELMDQLIEYWRDLLVVNCTGLENQAWSVSGDHRAELARHAKALETDTILAGLDVLVTAKTRLRASQHSRVLVEMALVRLARLENLVALSQLTQWVAGEKPAAKPAPTPAPRLAQPSEAEKKKEQVSDETASVANQTPLTEVNISSVWQQVLALVGPMLAGDLKKVESVAIFGPNTIAIRLPPGYNRPEVHHLDSSRVARIEAALLKICGQPWTLRLEAAPGNADAAPASGPGATDTETVLSRTKRHRAEAAKQPLVSRAMDLLGAQIVQLDDDFGAAPGTAEPVPATEVNDDPD
jgi:DNA polymerase-3 subunit gamma/tau